MLRIMKQWNKLSSIFVESPLSISKNKEDVYLTGKMHIQLLLL